jgi:lipopolysaccharide export LptBFGC system permease protein LptF
MISDMAAGEPGWLTWLELHAASALAGRGLAVSAVLAAALVVAAVGAYLPARAARLTLVLALVLAAALWLAGGLGGVLTGSATDPGTGPLLALLAVAYWPARDTARVRAAAGPTGGV